MRFEPLDRESVVAAEFCLTPDFAGFQGHFDGRPILPGICIMEAVLIAADEALDGRRLRIREIKSAKFFSPVMPDMAVRMEVHVERAEDGYCLRAVLNSGGSKMCRMTLFVV